MEKALVTNPFKIAGAPNVTLETVKRGEADRDEGHTVVLRLVEKRGGHASFKLLVHGLRVDRAEVVNILEDFVEHVEVIGEDSDIEFSLLLNMRGFEIKTVKLYVNP